MLKKTNQLENSNDEYILEFTKLSDRFPCQSRDTRLKALAQDCKESRFAIDDIRYFVNSWKKTADRFPNLKNIVSFMRSVEKKSNSNKKTQNYNCPSKLCDGTGVIYIIKNKVEFLRECTCSSSKSFLVKYDEFEADIEIPDYQRNVFNYYKLQLKYKKNNLNLNWQDKE